MNFNLRIVWRNMTVYYIYSSLATLKKKYDRKYGLKYFVLNMYYVET